MKRTYINLWLSALLIALLPHGSCKKSDNNQPATGNGQCSWTLNVDGQNYNWTGTYPATGTNNGQSVYVAAGGSNPTSVLSLSSSMNAGVVDQIVAVSFSTVRTGTFSMNPSTYNALTGLGETFTLTLNGADQFASYGPGSSMNVNITELSPNTYLTNGLNGAGFVRGNFSGRLFNVQNGSMANVSGTFNSIRLQ